jgi:hypothetical protein
MQYHRAAHACDRGRFVSFRRDDDAYWLDELQPTDENDAPLPEQPLSRCAY